MKKIISYAACLLIVSSVAATPDSKILKAFMETFPNASNVKWSDDKDGYFVSFIQNGNFEKVLYSKKGEFVCSWKYCDGKELPATVLMSLNKKYNNCTISGVTEYATDQDVTYEIKLSDSKNWYSLTISSDGKITGSQKFSN